MQPLFLRSMAIRGGLLLGLIGSLGFPSISQAQSPSCENLQSAQALLDCVIANHPAVQLEQAEVNIVNSNQMTARQRPNPELDSRFLAGIRSNEDFLAEINFGHVFELGKKRERRIEYAQAQNKAALLNQRITQEKVILETVLALHRLRQIQAERSALKESSLSLHKIQVLYRSRPLLDPEQQASQAAFELAEKEYILEIGQLAEEELQLKSVLEAAVGKPLSFKAALLPRPLQRWPRFLAISSDLQAAELKKGEAELESAQKSSKLAESEAKPNLKLGPSFETRVGDGKAGVGLGLNLSMPLPLYHRNQGQRQEALLKERKARLNLELLRNEKQLEYRRLRQTYSKLLEFLNLAQKLAGHEQQHQKIESLFQRGLISSTLILETHRQLVESKQKFHELELKAIEALWRIYALEGRILEEKL